MELQVVYVINMVDKEVDDGSLKYPIWKLKDVVLWC